MQELKIKTNTAGTTTVAGCWELRAGSHSTEEWLGGQGAAYVHSDTADATTGYPGSLTPFGASNTGGAAQGYDPAPKLALLTMTSASGGNSVIAVTEGGGKGEGATSVLSVSVSQRSGTASTSVPTLLTAVASGEITLTLTTVGVGNVGVYDIMVLYN
tara:strand:- start:3327 stop:3800 length:474 start_codon:yes stop_codon:yes gene_type:complete